MIKNDLTLKEPVKLIDKLKAYLAISVIKAIKNRQTYDEKMVWVAVVWVEDSV